MSITQNSSTLRQKVFSAIQTEDPPRQVFHAYRKFNLLRMRLPEDTDLKIALMNELHVKRKVSFYDCGQLTTALEEEPCYDIVTASSGSRYMITGSGFESRIRRACKLHGYELFVHETNKLGIKDLMRLMPNKGNLGNLNLRTNQYNIINEMLSSFRGQFIASTGSGKSTIIKHVNYVFPFARVLVTTFSNAVLQQLYKNAKEAGVTDAGIYCSALKENTSAHSMFVSTGSLQHFSRDVWDIFILDERHEAGTIKRMKQLFKIKSHRAYGFSAQENDRSDNADKWTEAIFGPVRTRFSMKAAKQANNVVGVVVDWVNDDVRKYDRYVALDATEPMFNSLAIWNNEVRNQRIADEVKRSLREYGQTLVYVRTIEHALALRALLDCPVACGKPSKERKKELEARAEAAIGDFRFLSDVERLELQHAFADGDVPLVICTSVWKRGVDFPGLRCVVRADGGASVEESVQVTGRVTRTFPGKEFGYVIDFVDDFHSTLKGRAQSRRRIYKRESYEQKGWS